MDVSRGFTRTSFCENQAPGQRFAGASGDAGDWIFAEPCKRLLQHAIAIGHRREALTDATLKTYRRDLERQLGRLLERSPRVEVGVKLVASIGRWKDSLFVFVTRRDVSPTNNVSERQLRPSVISPPRSPTASARSGAAKSMPTSARRSPPAPSTATRRSPPSKPASPENPYSIPRSRGVSSYKLSN